MTHDDQKIRNIVIIGGGIIGCTTAYYLTRHSAFSTSVSVTLLEASIHGSAQGASGKAGGLVAKWAYPKELVNLSFNEHEKLAKEHNGQQRWGWRFVNVGTWEGRGDIDAITIGLEKRRSLEKVAGLNIDGDDAGLQSGAKRATATGLPEDLTWVQKDLTTHYSSMAPTGATAQVHPYLFTTSMLQLAKESGNVASLHGKATSIETTDGNVTGVTYLNGEGKTAHLSATDVIVAAGAWSPSIVPKLPITHTRAHSITIHPDPSITISPYVLFSEITLPSGVFTPEIYARPGNEVYLCGPGDDEPLPDSVDDVRIDSDACESIWQQGASISHQLREGTVDKRQACYLPLGGPIIGAAPSIAKGLYIATGHTCWGISNAPGTAKAMSELVMDGEVKCADIKKLSPAHFFVG